MRTLEFHILCSQSLSNPEFPLTNDMQCLPCPEIHVITIITVVIAPITQLHFTFFVKDKDISTELLYCRVIQTTCFIKIMLK